MEVLLPVSLSLAAALVRSLLGWKRGTCQGGRAMVADARRAECGGGSANLNVMGYFAAAALGDQEWDPGAFDCR